ncbi:hypothetical protein PVK06_005629 [Gossypium arboreum]|uniref:Reverse transcriptase n=1 Tax=Gossypium arboreum TaxID=29729 RepID=A0ABR0QVA3_GOSAR|nr:hypothetical protein PVK06_005629 [Gossypium arboreum]
MHKSMRNGMGCFKSKRKRQKGLNGENINESLLKIVRRLLGNKDRLLELSWDWKPCNSSMDSCLTVDAIGKSRGLALLWREGTKVDITNYSRNHIDSLIHLDNDNIVRFTIYYGNADQNHGNSSWDMLKRVGRAVKETWIVGVFNAIFNNSKESGRRKSKPLMDNFREVVDELSLVDLEIVNWWFT